MPRIQGILETALYVCDPHASAAYYQNLFSFDTLLDSERLVALDVAGKNVLLLFKAGATDGPFETPGGTIPGHGTSGPTHFAFSIASDDVEPWRKRLEEAGVEVESTVTWPSGSISLYFRDPDNHLVELITPGFWKLS